MRSSEPVQMRSQRCKRPSPPNFLPLYRPTSGECSSSANPPRTLVRLNVILCSRISTDLASPLAPSRPEPLASPLPSPAARPEAFAPRAAARKSIGPRPSSLAVDRTAPVDDQIAHFKNLFNKGVLSVSQGPEGGQERTSEPLSEISMPQSSDVD